ncbi:PKD domain-containing protein [Flavobacterium sp. 3-210]
MSYYIDIIDQELNESKFVLEVASKSGITLSWNGGDSKDDLAVVGSALEFDIAHTENVDAKFINFFTGNEIRFKVELRNQSDDSLVWTGFLIPDTYSEPWTNGVVFVKITASCGLGRLKGKYPPESYYRDEKSVIDIICACLKLTSLGLNVFFNPAIENSVQKDWNQIYIDTITFFTDEKRTKKQDAYSILEKLMQDTLCVCFQADSRWNVEGINKRNIRSYDTVLYNENGVLIGRSTGNKLLKKVTAFASPNVTMIPPYNMITVSHERKPQAFPSTISKESNEGWAVVSGVKGEVYATDWNGNNAYYCKSIQPDYYNSVKKEYVNPDIGGISEIQPFDETKFINLKNKIFFYKDQRVTISMIFKIIKWANVMSGILPGAYYNPLLYEVLLNDVVLYTNRTEVVSESQSLSFDPEDLTAELNFDIIIPNEGLLDIKIWRPSGEIIGSNISGFELTKLEITPINFQEIIQYVDLINGEFTIDKEIELNYADDDTAFSKAFRLAKLKEATDFYNVIEVPVLYRFEQNGQKYSVVDLDGANLIKDNINTVYHEGILLSNLEVTYNFGGGEQMVIRTDFVTTASFFVRVYKFNDYDQSRTSWLEWTDSIYKIETSRYGQIVANVIRRMFGIASEKIDMIAVGAVKFNDIIQFKYVYDKQFVPVNCSWNLGQNETTLTLSRVIYKDSGDSGENPENIPPIVNAGPDIVLDNDQTSVEITAVANDVDGFIVFQKWTKLLGGFGDVIVSPNELKTVFENLTEDQYQYQIEVTDNDGATATDVVTMIRKKDYDAALDLIFIEGADGGVFLFAKYQFVIDPNIDPSYSLLLKGVVNVFSYNPGLETSFARFRIVKNGVIVYSGEWNHGDAITMFPFTISYISTDIILFEIDQNRDFPEGHWGSSWIDLTKVEFITGAGNINGLPIYAQPVPGPFTP